MKRFSIIRTSESTIYYEIEKRGRCYVTQYDKKGRIKTKEHFGMERLPSTVRDSLPPDHLTVAFKIHRFLSITHTSTSKDIIMFIGCTKSSFYTNIKKLLHLGLVKSESKKGWGSRKIYSVI